MPGTPTFDQNSVVRTAAPWSTLLPLALSLMARPSRISAVIRALLQNVNVNVKVASATHEFSLPTREGGAGG